ncbi:MAG: RHS repeat-associated core domain-containing protein, partial [Planctomycetota bacterium]
SSNQTRLTSVTYPGGREIDFDYGTSGGIDDALSRVQQLLDGATTLAEYNYLGAGTAVQLSYPQPDEMMDLWDETTGTYTGLDRFGRIIDLPWIQGPSGTPTDVARIKYGYNRASSPTYVRDEIARSNGADLDQLYSYDGLQRLIDFQQGQLNAGNTAITSSTLTQDWDLDQVGNWGGFNQGVSGVLNQTRTHNRVNEITGISNGSGQPVWIDPAYDDAGNMTLTPRPDAPTDGFALTYDAWNRITQVETTDVSPELVAKYGYDGRNHRISKEVYDAAGSLESTIKFFCNASWQCLGERETPVGGSSSTSTYVWGQRYIDDLVCRDDASDRLYALQDRQYKTIAVTNTSGTVQERYNYTPYGETFVYDATFTPRTASAFDWVYLYTGRRLDRETGLYNFRNRYFVPSLGRFFSKDPIVYDGRDLNLYRYVGNNPLTFLDPSGQSFWCPISGLATTVIFTATLVSCAALLVPEPFSLPRRLPVLWGLHPQ